MGNLISARGKRIVRVGWPMEKGLVTPGETSKRLKRLDNEAATGKCDSCGKAWSLHTKDEAEDHEAGAQHFGENRVKAEKAVRKVPAEHAQGAVTTCPGCGVEHYSPKGTGQHCEDCDRDKIRNQVGSSGFHQQLAMKGVKGVRLVMRKQPTK